MIGDLSSYRPKDRFSKNAQAYARWRPSYPPEALTFILEGLHGDRLTIADVGAGTGISSRLLAERGADVIAIDPNAEMLHAAEERCGVRYQHGSAEETMLPSASVDIVTAFQAFHWFARDTAMAEFKRILKRPGRAAFVWNNREQTNPFDAAFAALMQTFGEEAAIIDRGSSVAPPQETLAAHGFKAIQRGVFTHVQSLDRDGLVGRAQSTSYLPQEGVEYDRLIAELARLHERFADTHGRVHFSYRTVVHRGHLY